MKLTANNVWFTSDTHYSHSNIVRGTTNWRNEDGEVPLEDVRDFETLEEMNSAMVNNINELVSPGDFLVHLGDWSFGGIEKISEFRSMINCENIIVIMGNHDHHIQRDKEKVRKNFFHVSNYEEMKVSGNLSFVLCHYPIISWNGQRKGTYMLHGHQHLKREKRFSQAGRMDVGICGHPEFRPYHIEEVVKEITSREANLLSQL